MHLLPRLLAPFIGLALAAGLVTLPGPALAASDPSVSRAASGCRTQYDALPWGRLPLRTWTPTNSDPGAGTLGSLGIRSGAPFRASLVQATSRDSPHSKEMVTLRFADGCQRSYRASSFSSADRAEVRRVRATRPVAPLPSGPFEIFHDPAFITEQMQRDGRAGRYDTEHFSLWWGTDESAFSRRWVRERGQTWEQFLVTAGAAAEETYAVAARDLLSPMPYAGESRKRKVNLFICGTGLPFWGDPDTGDCGAMAGSRSMFTSAVYLQEGSSTLMHEFVHVLQDFSGGFRGMPTAGHVWEGHADWAAASIGTSFNAWYMQNLENGPTWFTNRYGQYPLMLQLSDRAATRPLVWRAWRENLRDRNGDTREEFLETVVRLGRAQGTYPRGWTSFADELGWYGARLAADDFRQQQVYRDTVTNRQEASKYVGLTRGSTRGSWSSPSRRPLWQFGSHLVPLKVERGARKVSVRLAGMRAGSTAGWRYSLVARDPGSVSGAASYSTLGASVGTKAGGEVRILVRPGREYFLAVTATPTRYERLRGDDPRPDVTTYPYRVRLTGASPRLSPTAVCQGPYAGPDPMNLNWNTNGRFTYDRPCQ